MSSTVTCRVLLKNYNDLKNITIGETSPDFEYPCHAYQYCCYNYTVPHSPWCCDASLRIIYKDWYLWVILALITILIVATFFYFRFYQKHQLERRIIRATLELESHYRPLQYQPQVVSSIPNEDDKSWRDEDDPPPCYSEISRDLSRDVPPDSSPPSYSSNKNIVTSSSSGVMSSSSGVMSSSSGVSAHCSGVTSSSSGVTSSSSGVSAHCSGVSAHCSGVTSHSTSPDAPSTSSGS